jgi:hypothetical protein
VDLPDVTAESEEGFADLAFRLIRSDVGGDGAHHVEAWGQHNGQPVAFLAVLEPTWEPQPIEDTPNHWYWGWVLLRSVGTASDAFVRALDLLYGTSLGYRFMQKETRWRAVGLAEDPRRLVEQPVHMKLFFEHDDEARYAEVYLNIDSKAERVEFHEKDEGYRRPLLLALGGAAAEQGVGADEPQP